MTKSFKESSILAFIKGFKKSSIKNGVKQGGGFKTKFDLSLLKEKSGFLSSVFATLVLELVVVGLVVIVLAVGVRPHTRQTTDQSNE
jgi:hypothetical protein